MIGIAFHDQRQTVKMHIFTFQLIRFAAAALLLFLSSVCVCVCVHFFPIAVAILLFAVIVIIIHSIIICTRCVLLTMC